MLLVVFLHLLFTRSPGVNASWEYATRKSEIVLPPDSPLWFVHIPKTAGTSFSSEMRNLFMRWGGCFVSAEVCLRESGNWQLANRPECMQAQFNHATFLREPRSHVLSQFMQCAYNKWTKEGTNGSFVAETFPGQKQRSNGDLSKEERKKLDLRSLDQWLDRFNATSDTYVQDLLFGRHSYNCYHPGDMQTRFLSERGYDCKYTSSPIMSKQKFERAKSSVKRIAFLGLKEEYEASMCMVHFQVTGFLPPYCDCLSEKSPPERPFIRHGVPKYHLEDLSEDTLQKIDYLIQQDRKLYGFGKKEFWKRIDAIERVTTVRFTRCESAGA